MEFVPLLALSALVLKVIDFLRYLTAKEYTGALTQAIAWVAGIAVVFLFAASDFSSGIDIGGAPLDSLNFYALVIIGLTVASTGGLATDVLKAVDGKRSSAKPRLGADTGGYPEETYT
jgi:hypothetical protein